MHKEFVHTTRFVHELFLQKHMAHPGKTRRPRLADRAPVHPIRDALGQRLIAIGERLVDREPVIDEAA